jgi:hypothetical protein
MSFQEHKKDEVTQGESLANYSEGFHGPLEKLERDRIRKEGERIGSLF